MDAKFSPRVKDVISYSREEALRLGHDYIGVEHLLLGIIREGEGVAMKMIKSSGVDSKELRKKLESDPVVQNVYKVIQLNTQEILGEPLLERIIPGRRLLGVSRKMLYRMNMLGMVYFIDKDPGILDRINQIIKTKNIVLKNDLKIYWNNFPIAYLTKGNDYLKPEIIPIIDDVVETDDKNKLQSFSLKLNVSV